MFVFTFTWYLYMPESLVTWFLPKSSLEPSYLSHRAPGSLGYNIPLNDYSITIKFHKNLIYRPIKTVKVGRFISSILFFRGVGIPPTRLPYFGSLKIHEIAINPIKLPLIPAIFQIMSSSFYLLYPNLYGLVSGKC